MRTITQQLEANRKWKAKNKDKVNAQKRRWRKKHPDKVKAQRERHHKKKYGNQQITTPESFFESEEWKKVISKHIIQDLGNALTYSNFINRKYSLDISTTILMKKAKELQDLKPKILRPKNNRKNGSD